MIRYVMHSRQRDWRERNPEAPRAHGAVANAKHNGSLTPKPCEVCGAAPADAHHDDYSRPLDVRWLCRSHHNNHHSGAPPMTSRIEPECYSVAEAAIECRRSAATIRRWIRDGRLEAIVLPSGRRLVPREALGQFQRIPAAPRNGHKQGARFAP